MQYSSQSAYLLTLIQFHNLYFRPVNQTHNQPVIIKVIFSVSLKYRSTSNWSIGFAILNVATKFYPFLHEVILVFNHCIKCLNKCLI